jgi:hypothetical protein
VMHRKQRTNKIHSFTPKTWLGTKRKKKKKEKLKAIWLYKRASLRYRAHIDSSERVL